MKKTTLLILSLVFVSSIMAQPRGYKKARIPHKSFGAIGMRNQGPQGFGQHSDRMEMMMTWRLTEELELTLGQADKFFPRMKAHRDNMESIETEIRETVKDVRRKIKDGKDVSDSEFNEMFGKITTLEKQKVDEKTRFITELNGILDNTQRVKLAMFKTKFAKEMQEQIRMKRKTKLK